MDLQSLDLMANLNVENEFMEMNEESERENQSGTQHITEKETQLVSQAEVQTVTASNKRLKSDVWKEFEQLGVEQDGKRRSRCMHCSKKLVSGLGQGTSALKRHLDSCTKRPLELGVDRQYDQKVDRDLLSEIIIYHDQPFRYVEYEKVRARDKYLRKYAKCGDTKVEEMAQRMQMKFSKYWDEYSLILAMGAVLDPRLKLQILKSAYNRVDPTTSEEKVEVVKTNLKMLYEEYRTKSWTSSSTFSATTTPRELLTESPLEDDLNYDIFQLERDIDPDLDNTKTNLDIYLDEPRLDSRSFTDIEVLDYWKNNGQRFGDLASLACDLLSIPITTVASESAFSIGGRVLSPYRNRLLPRNVQALLCTRNWLRGFAEFEGDVEDNFEDEKEEDTTMESSSGV